MIYYLQSLPICQKIAVSFGVMFIGLIGFSVWVAFSHYGAGKEMDDDEGNM